MGEGPFTFNATYHLKYSLFALDLDFHYYFPSPKELPLVFLLLVINVSFSSPGNDFLNSI